MNACFYFLQQCYLHLSLSAMSWRYIFSFFHLLFLKRVHFSFCTFSFLFQFISVYYHVVSHFFSFFLAWYSHLYSCPYLATCIHCSNFSFQRCITFLYRIFLTFYQLILFCSCLYLSRHTTLFLVYISLFYHSITTCFIYTFFIIV